MEYVLIFVVVAAMFISVVKMFLNADKKRRQQEYRARILDEVLPNRLQAYERLALYLERISPENMVLREQINVENGKDLRILMTNNVRQEFEHNVAMQIYISEASWSRIIKAKDEVLKTLNEASKGLNPKTSAIEYGAEVIEHARNNCNFYIERAQDGLRRDLAGEFVNL